MRTLLHVTADYPDRLNPRKTTAVARLVETVSWAENIVFSLNRVATPRFDWQMHRETPMLYSAAYYGLPFGVGLAHWMDVVANRILRQLRIDDHHPALIHAHKLTFEGIAASELSQQLAIPYCITVRGHTDHRVIKAKPFLRRRYRQIIEGASRVFFIAPWSRLRLEQQLDIAISQAVMLPNICADFEAVDASPTTSNRFVSVFHFRNHRVKNIANVFRALRLLTLAGQDVTLDVVGGADQQEIELVQGLALRHGVARQVTVLRAMTHAEMKPRMGGYAGLLLPSYPETFGLVYIEALSAGLPVIHARNSGIDGYFDDIGVATGVDHHDPVAIAQAMSHLLSHQAECKAEVRLFRARGGLDIFGATSVSAVYQREIEGALNAASRA